MSNVRLLNPASDELNVSGVRYAKDETGAFNVPENVAALVVNGPGGFFRGPDVAPPPAEKLAWNPVFNVHSVAVTLSNDSAGRLLALEAEHFGRLNLDGEFPVGDASVTAAEARALTAQYRQRLTASL
jgi:hypothetical protein